MPVPRGNYIPATRSGPTIRTAGMTPRRAGQLTVVGRVGADVDLDTAYAAAALAVTNAIAAARSMLAPTERLEIMEMTVYIACEPNFTRLSAVADGASDTLSQMADDVALPARSAVGVYALPDGAPVEVALVAEAVPR
ncbi:RidA family protein [Gordonia sp. PKS22-38]|uniref:RidA family protein n=1 Tax=Gordonia prachuapensis TaxID=3115651 RepID=A0ABU7MTB7_9ACTN|nr:RidA family protein [Gordonia sp. PKS22-38]